MNKFIFITSILLSINANSQTIRLDVNNLEAVKVSMSIEKLMASDVVIALWVETGTEGYFKDLKITKQ